MNEKFMFVVSVMAISVLVVFLAWLFLKVKYQHSVRLDKDTALLDCIRDVEENYSDEERDRLKEAIESGEFKDDRVT